MSFYLRFGVVCLSLFSACTHARSQDSSKLLPPATNFHERLADSAESLSQQLVQYDPQYFVIPYPKGDVPADKGVCTDVVIRAYRKMGIDLQQLVHEDMKKHFHLYPKRWGLRKPDPNIDHRRVPNLMVFFGRFGKTLALSENADDYRPGDVVCWDLGGGVTHTGMVVRRRNGSDSRCLIIHNIGGGQVLADCLFNWKIIGHYRYGSPR